MTAVITALIAEATRRRLWLRSIKHPEVWLSPAQAEAMGVEEMSELYPDGWELADRFADLRNEAMKGES